MPKLFRALPLFFVCLVAACGATSQASEPAQSQIEAEVPPGAAIFETNGCVACHALEAGPDAPEIGPPLEGLATRTSTTIKSPAYTGQADSVEAYIRESIVDPEAYVVEGFTPLMPKTFQSTLSKADLTALVEFLVTLK